MISFMEVIVGHSGLNGSSSSIGVIWSKKIKTDYNINYLRGPLVSFSFIKLTWKKKKKKKTRNELPHEKKGNDIIYGSNSSAPLP